MKTNVKDGAKSDAINGAECGCAVREAPVRSRKALGVDPEVKSRNLTRLRRIEGQVRGLQKMVDEDRYCADILTQISSVQEALRGVGRELMRNHLRHCAAGAIRTGGQQADRMYDELVDLMYTHSR
jgi:CsoR family transcriptional regulator, copper-sensing transcriptional repressor